MYEKNSAIRLAVYSVAGVICAVLLFLGVIDAEQSESITNSVGALAGILVAALAAFNVNKVDEPETVSAPVVDEPVITVGAFQERG